MKRPSPGTSPAKRHPKDFSVLPLAPAATKNFPYPRYYISDPYAPPISSSFQPPHSLFPLTSPEDAKCVAAQYSTAVKRRFILAATEAAGPQAVDGGP
ncbi:hypothetical protein SLA2020_164680 [Shorea laevis]